MRSDVIVKSALSLELFIPDLLQADQEIFDAERCPFRLYGFPLVIL